MKIIKNFCTTIALGISIMSVSSLSRAEFTDAQFKELENSSMDLMKKMREKVFSPEAMTNIAMGTFNFEVQLI